MSDVFDKLRELEVGHRLLLANTSGVFGQQFDQLVPEFFLVRNKKSQTDSKGVGQQGQSPLYQLSV